jgi:hypothetical protein
MSLVPIESESSSPENGGSAGVKVCPQFVVPSVVVNDRCSPSGGAVVVVVVLVVVVVVVVVGIDRDRLSWLPNWSIRLSTGRSWVGVPHFFSAELKEFAAFCPHASSATTPLFAAFE